jgi:hypothetical protein
MDVGGTFVPPHFHYLAAIPLLQHEDATMQTDRVTPYCCTFCAGWPISLCSHLTLSFLPVPQYFPIPIVPLTECSIQLPPTPLLGLTETVAIELRAHRRAPSVRLLSPLLRPFDLLTSPRVVHCDPHRDRPRSSHGGSPSMHGVSMKAVIFGSLQRCYVLSLLLTLTFFFCFETHLVLE